MEARDDLTAHRARFRAALRDLEAVTCLVRRRLNWVAGASHGINREAHRDTSLRGARLCLGRGCDWPARLWECKDPVFESPKSWRLIDSFLDADQRESIGKGERLYANFASFVSGGANKSA